MTHWAAVLAGGSGTRFWPLSTTSRPKQFLPLAGTQSLLLQSVARLEGLIDLDRVLVVTGQQFVAATRRALPMLPEANVLGEPRAASTAPALAWATWTARSRDADATVLSLHADWHVGDPDAFRRTARRALEVAKRYDVLVAVGVAPDRPEIGFGYIEPGDVLDGDAHRILRFREKPDAATAARLVSAGALWNSGLFAWTADRFLVEARAHAPELAPHLDRLAQGDVAGFFAAVTPIAVDHSHFERSRRRAVVSGVFGWDDVGTWTALSRVRPRDAGGNVAVGDVVLRDAAECVVWTDGEPVVVDGARDLVVVHANGVTLVTTRERAARLKELLESLPPSLRDAAP